MMNKDTKTLYDFIPNYPKGSTKPFIVKSGSKNTFDKISICENDIISNLTNPRLIRMFHTACCE